MLPSKNEPERPVNPLEAKVIALLHAACGQFCVAMTIDKGRRTADIALLHLWGDKKQVFKVIPKLLDKIPEVNLEIIRSGKRGEDYFLALAITEKAALSAIQLPERRAKLRSQVSGQVRRRITAHQVAMALELKRSLRQTSKTVPEEKEKKTEESETVFVGLNQRMLT
ncbi:MAG: hypothetical protein ACRCYY_01225 [Trueperaceae bacterium]